MGLRQRVKKMEKSVDSPPSHQQNKRLTTTHRNASAATEWGGKEGYPSGQRGQTVNLLAYAFGGSNPPPSTSFTL